MAAFGLGTLGLLAVQTAIAGFVYREANAHGRRSPAFAAATVFLVGLAAAVALGGALEVVLVQLALVALWIGLGPTVERRRA